MCRWIKNLISLLIIMCVLYTFSLLALLYFQLCICWNDQLGFSVHPQGEKVGDCWRHVPPHLQVGAGDGAQIRRREFISIITGCKCSVYPPCWSCFQTFSPVLEKQEQEEGQRREVRLGGDDSREQLLSGDDGHAWCASKTPMTYETY